jgi:3-oxoadipate enol-lactonase
MDDDTVTETQLDLIGPAPRIAVEHGGSGPLVLLIHGIGGNRTNWRPQMAPFAARFHVAAWDTRGYHDSDDYAGPMDFTDMAGDVVRVLDHFGVARGHLVGASMGGRIALDCALSHPDRIASLTLCNTFAGFESALSPEAQDDYLRVRLKPLVEDGKPPVDLAPRVIAALVGPNCPPWVGDEITACMAALRKESYVKAVEASAAFDRSADLGQITAPTLVLTGEHDRQPPPETARALADAIPGAEYVVLADSGHLTNMEQPDAFNAAVLDFLDRH